MASFKKSTATLIFVIFLSLIQIVYSDDVPSGDVPNIKDEDVLNTKCEYYCNITGKKYSGHTISKNTEGLTIGEHAKKLGDQYNYYILCCDGKLKSREGIPVIKNNLEIISKANVNMDGEFKYLNTDQYCFSYCGYDIKNSIAYLKYSEELSLTDFAKKHANEYDLFTYCCNGKLDDDRMTLTHDLEEFSLRVSLFNLDKNSIGETRQLIEKKFLSTSCSYYCGVEGDSIVSIIKNTQGQLIQDFAANMKLSGKASSGYTKCCDGQMRNRVNIPVYNTIGSITYYKNLKPDYTFDFMDYSQSCNYFCAFKNANKSVTILNTSGSLIEVARNNKGKYDYITYCCDNKEKDLGGSLVVVSPYGEEVAINSDLYQLVGSSNNSNKKQQQPW
ncbi:hypothetical protein BCR32DRAFT_329972 [Anaeromyces robustus]|uniref:Uncharacterized protein n=1 Tax=Anaeromyces robustus TaxID=1754192 RepID=A0A1Y1WNC7_9FUNG|nr:hypothetical protein BCR32DRAFT_329972 [Anaeromyces robustus]|eukprot:ORX75051.1 hypothetical protein BCR32DRAFT_329972 [Anaeromyces robustus]